MTTLAPTQEAIGDWRDVSVHAWGSDIVEAGLFGGGELRYRLAGESAEEFIEIPFRGDKDNISVCVLGDILHLVWSQYGNVRYARWNLRTRTVDSQPATIFAGTLPSIACFLVTRLIIGYVSPTGTNETRNSLDGGANWSAPTIRDATITDGPVESVNVSVSDLDDSQFAWSEAKGAVPGGEGLMFFGGDFIDQLVFGSTTLTSESTVSEENGWIGRSTISGEKIWAAKVASNKRCRVGQVLVDPSDGSVYASVYLESKQDVANSHQIRFYDSDNVLQSTLVGPQSTAAAGTMHWNAIAKWDVDGNLLWAKGFGVEVGSYSINWFNVVSPRITGLSLDGDNGWLRVSMTTVNGGASGGASGIPGVGFDTGFVMPDEPWGGDATGHGAYHGVWRDENGADHLGGGEVVKTDPPSPVYDEKLWPQEPIDALHPLFPPPPTYTNPEKTLGDGIFLPGFTVQNKRQNITWTLNAADGSVTGVPTTDFGASRGVGGGNTVPRVSYSSVNGANTFFEVGQSGVSGRTRNLAIDSDGNFYGAGAANPAANSNFNNEDSFNETSFDRVIPRATTRFSNPVDHHFALRDDEVAGVTGSHFAVPPFIFNFGRVMGLYKWSPNNVGLWCASLYPATAGESAVSACLNAATYAIPGSTGVLTLSTFLSDSNVLDHFSTRTPGDAGGATFGGHNSNVRACAIARFDASGALTWGNYLGGFERHIAVVDVTNDAIYVLSEGQFNVGFAWGNGGVSPGEVTYSNGGRQKIGLSKWVLSTGALVWAAIPAEVLGSFRAMRPYGMFIDVNGIINCIIQAGFGNFAEDGSDFTPLSSNVQGFAAGSLIDLGIASIQHLQLVRYNADGSLASPQNTTILSQNSGSPPTDPFTLNMASLPTDIL